MTEKMFRATVDGKNDVLVIETFVAGMRCYYRPGKSPKKHFYESEVSDLTPMHLVKTDAVVVEGVNDLEVIRDQGGLFLCPAHINIICREHTGYSWHKQTFSEFLDIDTDTIEVSITHYEGTTYPAHLLGDEVEATEEGESSE